MQGVCLLDPSQAEEELVTSRATVVLDPSGGIAYHLSLSGGEIAMSEVFAKAKSVLPQYKDFLQALNDV